MGCTASKVDDLPAVVLCRERCTFLDEAIRQRYLFAETHIHYVHSLKEVGHSLNNFINNQVGDGGDAAVSSPHLNLPPAKKGRDETTSAAVKGGGGIAVHHSHSNSGDGHIQFHSDPDEDDESGSSHSSPLSHDHDQDHDHDHHDSLGHFDYGNFPYGNFPYMNMMMNPDHQNLGGFTMNYMKNQANPSVVYEQKPVSPETVQHHYMGESSSTSSSYVPYPQFPYASHDSSGQSYGYPPNYGASHYGMAPAYGSPTKAEAVASSSKPPPSPPSPPKASAWDFLNPFQTFEKHYPPYTLNRDLKVLREEEGIPDLEDEDYPDVGKKVHVDEKFVDVSGGGRGGVFEDGDGDARASMYQTRPSVDNEGLEYEVPVVEKKVVEEERNREHSNAATRAASRDALDVARELEVLFTKASESGNQVATMLEVGKLPYQRKHVSRMLHVVTPSLSVVSSQPSTSKSTESSSSADKAGPALLDIEEDMAMRTKNLSSTLHKLYLWEKKLCNEVKVNYISNIAQVLVVSKWLGYNLDVENNEEKMRLVHDRKVRKLKRLDERGAEAHKVDSTRTVIRSLSIKIAMAIQVVDKISVTINKIRDEELWPQLNELIQGLTRMWKSMLECHRTQCQAIIEAKDLGPIASGKKGDAQLNATLKLEDELLIWVFRFSSWIGAQKGYVRALNGWLMKCLLDEPEETADGIAPFSPGRIGAPPVFVICNQWSQALDRVSEKEVLDSMRVLAMSVLQLWEQDKVEMRQRLVAHKDLERKVRILDKEDQKIQKEIQALDKKIVGVSGDGNNHLVPGHVVYQSNTSSSSLQGSLQHIFEAMERFTADSLKVYEELLQRTEEERVARENESAS